MVWSRSRCFPRAIGNYRTGTKAYSSCMHHPTVRCLPHLHGSEAFVNASSQHLQSRCFGVNETHPQRHLPETPALERDFLCVHAHGKQPRVSAVFLRCWGERNVLSCSSGLSPNENTQTKWGQKTKNLAKTFILFLFTRWAANSDFVVTSGNQLEPACMGLFSITNQTLRGVDGNLGVWNPDVASQSWESWRLTKWCEMIDLSWFLNTNKTMTPHTTKVLFFNKTNISLLSVILFMPHQLCQCLTNFCLCNGSQEQKVVALKNTSLCNINNKNLEAFSSVRFLNSARSVCWRQKRNFWQKKVVQSCLKREISTLPLLVSGSQKVQVYHIWRDTQYSYNSS